MRSYRTIGLLLAAVAAGGLSAGGVRAGTDEKAAPAKDTDAQVEKKVVKIRKAGPHGFAFGGGHVTFAGGGFLGIGIKDVDKDDLARLKLQVERGVIVTRVEPESAASAAGLKENDVILGFAGEPVRSAAQLQRLVAETPPERSVPLDVSHDGVVKAVEATLAERTGGPFAAALPALDALEDFEVEVPEPLIDLEAPEPPEPPAAPRPRALGKKFRFHFPESDNLMWRGGAFFGAGPRKLGIRYQLVGGQLAKYFKLSGDEGVLVTEVTEKSPAAAAGVQAGDVILKVNGKSIDDGSDLREALAPVKPGEEVALTVQREGKPLDLKVRAGGKSEKPERPTIST